MATISLNVPDAQMSRVVDALAVAGDYNPDVDGPKGAFAKEYVIRMVRQTVLSVERAEREREAMQSIVDPDPVDLS